MNEIAVDFAIIIRYNMIRLGHISQGMHSRDNWGGATVDAVLANATHSENLILNLLLSKK